MPYIETIVDRPDEKLYTPFPGMGADEAFRYIHWKFKTDPNEPAAIEIRMIDGSQVWLTIEQAGWLLAVGRDIPGRGMPLPSAVWSQRIRGLDCAVREEGMLYSIDIPGNPAMTMPGVGYYMMCEALAPCIDADTQALARTRRGEP